MDSDKIAVLLRRYLACFDAIRSAHQARLYNIKQSAYCLVQLPLCSGDDLKVDMMNRHVHYAEDARVYADQLRELRETRDRIKMEIKGLLPDGASLKNLLSDALETTGESKSKRRRVREGAMNVVSE